MKQRMSIKHLEPKAYQAMLGLEKYLEETQLTTVQKELIKIRASQINGCAFCIQRHTKSAREAGETEKRIYALHAWQESPLFTPEERIILALTEEVTLIADRRVSDATYSEAAKLFDEHVLAQIIMAIIIINSWNRIAVSTRMIPE